MNRCSYCGRRRETRRIQRFGGGSYKRAGRWYWGSICAECVGVLLDGQEDRTGGNVDRYSLSSLRHLAKAGFIIPLAER